jgi:hypothetical protein
LPDRAAKWSVEYLWLCLHAFTSAPCQRFSRSMKKRECHYKGREKSLTDKNGWPNEIQFSINDGQPWVKSFSSQVWTEVKITGSMSMKMPRWPIYPFPLLFVKILNSSFPFPCGSSLVCGV